MRTIRNWSAIAVPALLSLSACAPTTEPIADGIVSTSLCGDGYALASGAEIAALSWQSDGPLGSGWAGPKASVDVERLVAMQPEVLLLGPGESIKNGVLPGADIVTLEWAEDWDGVLSNFSRVPGPAPGPGQLGDDLTRPRVKPGEADVRRILYLSRAGGTAGPGTYVDEAIRLAGGTNAVTRPGWFTPDPEWIVAQELDVILTSFFDGYESVNAPAIRNIVVRRFINEHPRIDVPGRLWPCAGPGLAEAVQIIAEGLE